MNGPADRAIAALRAHAIGCSKLCERTYLYHLFHSSEVATHAVCIGTEFGLGAADLAILRAASELHDIGKLAISHVMIAASDRVLDREGEEFAIIKMHSEVGAQGVEAMAVAMPSQTETFYTVAQVIRSHHERWDGTGYPCQLAGWRIPLMARMLAIADSAKAMTTPERQWRSALNLSEMLAEIRRCAGTQFDPELAEMYCKMIEANRISLPVMHR